MKLTELDKQKRFEEFRKILLETEYDGLIPSASTPAGGGSNISNDHESTAVGHKYTGLNAQLSDADVHRFLRARNYNLQPALEMVLKWFQWYNTSLTGTHYTPRDMRRRFQEEGDIQEDVYREFLPHANLGHDKEGRPIYWEKTGLISSRFGKIKQQLTENDIFNRHVYQQEKMILRLEALSKKFGTGVEKQVVVFDLANLNYTIDFMAMNVMRRVLSIDQDMYPERLKYMFFINAPFFFTAIWAAFRSLLDPVTVDKIKIIGSNYRETLLKYIDEDQIPGEYGGSKENFAWEFPSNWDADDFICSIAEEEGDRASSELEQKSLADDEEMEELA